MNYAIIVAGGTGRRIGAAIPKQFIEVAGKPVIVHTIEVFLKSVPGIKIIIPLPIQWEEHWKKIEEKFFPEEEITISQGGETRFHSVKKALKFTTPDSFVAVHDAVRPVVSSELIYKTFNHAKEHRSAIPFINVTDSLRKKEKGHTVMVDRNDFMTVQTPQCFQQKILVKAYEQWFNEKFTDDATVVESSGVTLSFIEGDKNNIKITVPEDLKIAECLLK